MCCSIIVMWFQTESRTREVSQREVRRGKETTGGRTEKKTDCSEGINLKKLCLNTSV